MLGFILNSQPKVRSSLPALDLVADQAQVESAVWPSGAGDGRTEA